MKNNKTYNLFKKDSNISLNILNTKKSLNINNKQIDNVVFSETQTTATTSRAPSDIDWNTLSTDQAVDYISNLTNKKNIYAGLEAIRKEYGVDVTAGQTSDTFNIENLALATGLEYKDIYTILYNGNTEAIENSDDDENNPFKVPTSITFDGYSTDTNNNTNTNGKISVEYNPGKNNGNSNSNSIYSLEAQKEKQNLGTNTDAINGTLNSISEFGSLETPTSFIASEGEIYDKIINAFTIGKSQAAQGEYIIPKMHSKKHIADTIPLLFHFPKWGVNDFIKERANFQKRVDIISGDPGWFYFKIFFHFNSEYGLLGGIMDRYTNVPVANTNTAFKYLAINRNIYKQEHIVDRMDALIRFVRILSYINTNAPWFFKEVKGLDKANNIYTSNFSKEKYIEIQCNPDAVDMRLNAIMDLYKYAAFDNINCKEVIPQNLRLFDMTVMVFHSPIRYFQTSIKSKSVGTSDNNNVFPGKTLSKVSYEDVSKPDIAGDLNGGNYNSEISAQHVGNYTNTMSFEMFEFKDCWFNAETLGNMMASTVSNEKAVNLGNNSIKINYNRCFRGSMNEWFNYLHTDAGSLYGVHQSIKDNRDFQEARMKALQKAIDNINYYDPTKAQYKELIDASESVVRNAMMAVNADIALGNIYDGENGEIYYKKHTPKNTDTENNADYDSININSSNIAENYGKYFTSKMQLLKNGSIVNTDSSAKHMPNLHQVSPMIIHNKSDFYNPKLSEYFFLKLQQLKYGSAKGNIYEYDMGPRHNNELFNNYNPSEYFKYKIQKLKNSGLSGNIYKYEIVPNIQLYDGNPQYTENKFEKIKLGTIKGNLYNYETGSNSNYFKAKLDAVKGKRKRTKIKLSNAEFENDYNPYTDTKTGEFLTTQNANLVTDIYNNRKADQYLHYPTFINYNAPYLKNNYSYRNEWWAPSVLSLTQYKNNILEVIGSLSDNFDSFNSFYYMQKYNDMTAWKGNALTALADIITDLVNTISTLFSPSSLINYIGNLGKDLANSAISNLTNIL